MNQSELESREEDKIFCPPRGFMYCESDFFCARQKSRRFLSEKIRFLSEKSNFKVTKKINVSLRFG